MGLCCAGEMQLFRSLIAIEPREYSCSKRDHSFPQSTLTSSSKSADTVAALRFAAKGLPTARAVHQSSSGAMCCSTSASEPPAWGIATTADNHLSEWIAGGTMIEVLYFSVIAAKRPPPSETRNPVVGSTDMGLNSAGDRNE